MDNSREEAKKCTDIIVKHEHTCKLKRPNKNGDGPDEDTDDDEDYVLGEESEETSDEDGDADDDNDEDPYDDEDDTNDEEDPYEEEDPYDDEDEDTDEDTDTDEYEPPVTRSQGTKRKILKNGASSKSPKKVHFPLEIIMSIVNAAGAAAGGKYENSECGDDEDDCPACASERGEDPKITAEYNGEEYNFFKTMESNKKLEIMEIERRIVGSKPSSMPVRFKILMSNTDDTTKGILLEKLSQLQNTSQESSGYSKMKIWIDQALKLPLGKYIPLQVNNDNTNQEIITFLNGVEAHLNNTVYGHKDVKEQILRILAQWISNPGSRGNVIGIQGSMGVGKTRLVKEGIAKALGLPFAMVALGGAADASFLEGHSYTYEGSTYGKVAEVLMNARCMNPVIFFDELDKVSDTRRGEEIIGLLTHLTDGTQNDRYNDKYFTELNLDMSRALIVFSYNHEDRINPILKDRMITIHVKGYDKKEKMKIAQDYMLPSILSDFGFAKGDITCPDDMIEQIILRIPAEEGVRNLRRALENIVSWINMHKYIGESYTLPLAIDEQIVNKFIYKNNTDESWKNMYM